MAGSSLPVDLAAGGACSVAPFTVTLTGTDQCVLTATQAGKSTYLPAPTTVQSPAPALCAVSPLSFQVGGPTTTLVLTGSGFTPGSVVQWTVGGGGPGSARSPARSGPAAASTTALATTYVSTTSLTATVPASVLATPGPVTVTVVNPTPGGGSSAGGVATRNTGVFMPAAAASYSQ